VFEEEKKKIFSFYRTKFLCFFPNPNAKDLIRGSWAMGWAIGGL